MPSFLYNRGLTVLNRWTEADVLRVLLERSVSTYSPDRDHNFLDAFTGGGGVEISVASYARQNTANRAQTQNDTADRLDLDADDVAFGALEAGQTVKAAILYRQTGGNDATPEDDELIGYFDGSVTLTLAADALINATTIFVDPLPAALASGATVDFGGGATAALTAPAAAGDRSLAVDNLNAAASAGAKSSAAINGNILPFALGGGDFSLVLPTAGLIFLQDRTATA